MSQEEYEQRVRDSDLLEVRLDKCHTMIGNMCKERRPPKMTIPLQWSDEDFYISVTIADAIKELGRLRGERDKYSQYLSPEDWEEVSDWMS